jgi:Arm DNA-binding domain
VDILRWWRTDTVKYSLLEADMPKLKALQVSKAKGPCTLSDGKGLYYEITSSGAKRWIYRYKIAGHESTFTVGHYSDLSLEKVRQAHIEAHRLVKQGLNLSKVRNAAAGSFR